MNSLLSRRKFKQGCYFLGPLCRLPLHR